MIKTRIEAGICGFATIIEAKSEDKQHVQLQIKTDCPDLKALEHNLLEVDGYQSVMGKLGETNIYQAVRAYCHHAACPVAMGITKTVEAACGLALPKDVHVTITKEEP
jgi:hypothetical protein